MNKPFPWIASVFFVLAIYTFSVAAEKEDAIAIYDGTKEGAQPTSQGWTAEDNISDYSHPLPKDGCITIETPPETSEQNNLRFVYRNFQDLGNDYFWQAKLSMQPESKPAQIHFLQPKWYDQIQIFPGSSSILIRTQPDKGGEIWMRVDASDLNKNEPHFYRMEHHGARFDFFVDGKKIASGISTYSENQPQASMQAYPSGSTRFEWYHFAYGILQPNGG